MRQSDPIVRFNKWFKQAVQAGAPLPESMALATVGRDHRVSVRFLLLKQADERGFIFYTDTRSPKGRDLRETPYASMAFYWDATGKQVRVEGPVEPVSSEEADAYWATRPRESRLSGSASTQSALLSDRRMLVKRVGDLRRRFNRGDIPRPGYWSGFRLLPDSIEFWTRRSHRLHDRELFTRGRNGWKRVLLQP